MKEKATKFNLSKELCEIFPEHDVEYRLYSHKDGLMKVKWIDPDGSKQIEHFDIDEVDDKFRNGIWIKR
jgi:hypothetical protein